MLKEKIDLLNEVVANHKRLAVAVSGGVDSLTLSCFISNVMGSRVEMYHAISPAVQSVSTSRVRKLAKERKWLVHYIDAGEFNDPRYIENPINRCFFCKKNLYGSISKYTQAPICSGTNLDDIEDFRPGLIAAEQNSVIHPYVSARMSKMDVRELANHLGLGNISEIPSSPCLSSRIETNIKITEKTLNFVESVEEKLRLKFGLGVVRCRIRKEGVVIEVGDAERNAIALIKEEILACVMEVGINFGFSGSVRVAEYKQGSAFVGNRAI